MSALPSADADRKKIATLSALLALRGYELHVLATGELLIARWGLRRLCTLSEAEDFARQVGAIE